jgi:hypothetical protein
MFDHFISPWPKQKTVRYFDTIGYIYIDIPTTLRPGPTPVTLLRKLREAGKIVGKNLLSRQLW